MENTNVQEVNLRQLITILKANKKMTQKEVAEISGRTQCQVSNLIRKGDTKISILRELLNACGEDIILLSSNGQKFKLV